MILYFALLIFLGLLAKRKSKNTREDYFLSSRNFGTLILFFSVLATVASAFAVIGFPGEVYRTGVANFGAIITAAILLIPLTYATAGQRMWLVSERFNQITPSEMVKHRYDSRKLGILVSFLLIFWTVPYLVLGGIGGALAFELLTDGLVSYSQGAALLLALVSIYLFIGGMRGSGYTDVIQGILIISLMLTFTLFLTVELGGLESAMTKTADEDISLISREGNPQFSTQGWLSSFIFMGLAVLMFPHIMLRIFSANSLSVLKKTVLLFPAGIFLIMLTSTLIGFMGAGEMPGLQGSEADNIVPNLLLSFAPSYLIAAALIVILSAIMSSLDSQTLSVSTLISEDFLGGFNLVEDRLIPLSAKILTLLIMVIVYGLILIQPGSIFYIVGFAFQGYALLFYPTVIGLYWKNATEKGVLTGYLFGFIGIWIFQFGLVPETLRFGFLPVIPLLVGQILITHLISHFTRRPTDEFIRDYFATFRKAW